MNFCYGVYLCKIPSDKRKVFQVTNVLFFSLAPKNFQRACFWSLIRSSTIANRRLNLVRACSKFDRRWSMVDDLIGDQKQALSSTRMITRTIYFQDLSSETLLIFIEDSLFNSEPFENFVKHVVGRCTPIIYYSKFIWLTWHFWHNSIDHQKRKWVLKKSQLAIVAGF